VSDDALDVGFRQRIGRIEPLRTGSYATTVTFTLSTTTP
jgi:X-Pro dipeptidyl-peptidase